MKYFFSIVAVLLSFSLFAQGTDTATVKFKVTTFSFGKIKQGVPVTTEFSFTNTGSKPLIIENAEAGCGCTTPDYPKEPIMKGKSGKIKVTYNAASTGQFTKNVNVKFAGAQLPVTLLIQGEVVAPNQ
jgi:hypothetical protein